jgi:hypothetical protein
MNGIETKLKELEETQEKVEEFRVQLEEAVVLVEEKMYATLMTGEIVDFIEQKEGLKEVESGVKEQIGTFLETEGLKEAANTYMNEHGNWYSMRRRGYGGLEGVMKLLVEKKPSSEKTHLGHGPGDSWAHMNGEILKYVEAYETLTDEIKTAKMNSGASEVKFAEKMKELPLNKRVVILDKLFSDGYLGDACGGFGSYKSPTTCGGCHAGKSMVYQYDVEDAVSFVGDRQYEIKKETLDSMKSEVAEELGIVVEALKTENVTKGVDLAIKVEELKEDITLLTSLDKPDMAVEEADGILENYAGMKGFLKDKTPSYKTIDLEKGIAVTLEEKSYYPGGGCGMQYSVLVSVYRDGQEQSQKYIYRDAYSASKDDWSLNFQTAEIKEVTPDAVTVKLSSSSKNKTVTFDLEAKVDAEVAALSSEEQRAYKTHYGKVVEELIIGNTRTQGIAPVYHDLEDRTGGVHNTYYDTAEVVDEYVRADKGEGVVVIKTQIDSKAGGGKQFGWTAYKITMDETEMIARDNAYQLGLKQGKEIHMEAQELLNK